MKKQNLFLIPLLSLFFTLSTFAGWEAESLTEVAVMHARDDGNYDVFCTDGSRETVTDLDIRLNNVCPNLKSNKPTNILSLQKREDGDFDVVCRNLNKLVATEAQIIEGSVCNTVPPKVVLENGTYKVTSGYSSYYNQNITSVMNGSVLKSITLRVSETGWVCELECQGNSCQGISNNSTCRNSKIEVLGLREYRYIGSSGEAIFGKLYQLVCGKNCIFN